jgi:hypothetical protein
MVPGADLPRVSLVPSLPETDCIWVCSWGHSTYHQLMVSVFLSTARPSLGFAKGTRPHVKVSDQNQQKSTCKSPQNSQLQGDPTVSGPGTSSARLRHIRIIAAMRGILNANKLGYRINLIGIRIHNRLQEASNYASQFHDIPFHFGYIDSLWAGMRCEARMQRGLTSFQGGLMYQLSSACRAIKRVP